MVLPHSLINKITTMADGTIRIQLDFQEMPPEKMTELFMLKSQGELVQADSEIKNEGKTPSERLRAILYRLWEQTIDDREFTFSMYYVDKMREICEHFKSKLK